VRKCTHTYTNEIVFSLVDVLKELSVRISRASELIKNVSEDNRQKVWHNQSVFNWYVTEEGVDEIIAAIANSRLAKHLRRDENSLLLTP
jgi:hypothetical protein